MSDQSLPTIDFTTFVLSLSHSAAMYLGDAPHAESEKVMQSLPLARQTIDLLVLMEEKTKGNLTGEEERLLHETVSELRSRLAALSKG